MMAKCGSCGSELEPDDYFCGSCGAFAGRSEPTQHEPAAQASPEALEDSEAQVEDEVDRYGAEPARRRFSTATLALAIVASIAIGFAGGYVWLSGFRASQETSSEVAAIPTSSQPEATNPSPESTIAANPTVAGIDQLAGALNDVAAQIEGGTPLISPGLWQIRRIVNDISTPDLKSPGIPADNLPLGNEEQELQCVNAMIAADPGAYAFPAERSGGCTVRRFAMANGRYDAAMVCNWAGSRRQMTMTGDYDQASLQLIMRLEMPANEIAGESAGTRPLLIQYRIEGNRIGPC